MEALPFRSRARAFKGMSVPGMVDIEDMNVTHLFNPCNNYSEVRITMPGLLARTQRLGEATSDLSKI